MNEPHPESLKGRLQEWQLQKLKIELQKKLNGTPQRDPEFNSLVNELCVLYSKIAVAKEEDKKVLQEFGDQLSNFLNIKN